MPDLTETEPLLDPDCRDGKCGSCVGGPCEHHCHRTEAEKAEVAELRAKLADAERRILPAPERTPPDDNAACTLLLDELEDADEYSDDEPVWDDQPVCWAEHTPGNRLRCGLSVDHNGGHYFNTWEG